MTCGGQFCIKGIAEGSDELEKQKRNSGEVALTVALLALAQRLAGYENKPLAICLAVVGGGALLWFAGSWIADGLSWLRGLSRRDALATQAEAEKREKASLLSKAPKLWVDYKPRNPTEGEALIFSKEGDAAIKTIHVCPLVWGTIKQYPINLLSDIGPLRGQPIECRFTVFERIGGTEIPQQLYELPDLFKEMNCKVGHQTQPSVKILYEDFDGNWFCRTFVLSMDPYSQIVWKPDVVQLAKKPIL